MKGFVATLWIFFVCDALAKKKTSKKDAEPAPTSTLNIPSDMPTEHASMVHEKYAEFMKQNKKKNEPEKQEYPKPAEGISPKQLGLTRNAETSKVPLTKQVNIPSGVFWFGSQTDVADGKLMPVKPKDGAAARYFLSQFFEFHCYVFFLSSIPHVSSFSTHQTLIFR
jgi:hypothetical protein